MAIMDRGAPTEGFERWRRSNSFDSEVVNPDRLKGQNLKMGPNVIRRLLCPPSLK
jgi:hypothetical protein